jgi:uncharacterized membrane protein YqjE
MSDVFVVFALLHCVLELQVGLLHPLQCRTQAACRALVAVLLVLSLTYGIWQVGRATQPGSNLHTVQQAACH